MTETERQRHLDTAELVDESAGNAAVTADLPPDDPVRAGGETRSQWRDVWRQFRSHRGAMVALVLFVLVLLFVSIGPWLWTIDPTYAIEIFPSFLSPKLPEGASHTVSGRK